MVLLRVLSDSILFRVLSPRFLACRVPSVAFSVLNILIAANVLILSLGNLMQLPEIRASF